MSGVSMAHAGQVVAETELAGVGRVVARASWVLVNGEVYLDQISLVEYPPRRRRRELTEDDGRTIRQLLEDKLRRELHAQSLPGGAP